MLEGDGDRLQGDRDVRNQEESEEEREEISNKRESERVSWRGGQLVDVCFSSSFFFLHFSLSDPTRPSRGAAKPSLRLEGEASRVSPRASCFPSSRGNKSSVEGALRRKCTEQGLALRMRWRGRRRNRGGGAMAAAAAAAERPQSKTSSSFRLLAVLLLLLFALSSPSPSSARSRARPGARLPPRRVPVPFVASWGGGGLLDGGGGLPPLAAEKAPGAAARGDEDEEIEPDLLLEPPISPYDGEVRRSSSSSGHGEHSGGELR